jgi:Secretion system C-terminal sorting domain
MRHILTTSTLLLLGVSLLIPQNAASIWIQDGGTFNVDGNYNATNPDIAVDSNTPYVVWSEENASGDKQIYVKKYNGASWIHASGSVESLNVDGNESGHYPGIAAAAGTPYVVWAEDEGNTRVVYCKYLNGTTWEQMGSTSLNVDPNKFADYPAIALDGSTLYITWREDAVSAYHIFVKHWNGTDWEQDGGMLNLDGNEDGGYFPSVELINSIPFISWEEELKIYVKKFNGNSWEQADGILNDNINDNALISFVSNKNSTPYVTWSEVHLGNQRIYLKYYEANQWNLNGYIINNDTNKDAYPSGLEFNSQTPYIVFHEETYVSGQPVDKWHTYVKYFNGLEWLGTESSLNIDTNYDTDISGIGFVNNTLYVVWDEKSSGAQKIYCKYYIPPTPTYTATVTPTATITPTLTCSATYTETPTSTPTFTVTTTSTITPTQSPTYTITNTYTITQTATITPSITKTCTITPSATITSTATISATASPGVLVGKDEILAYPNPARDTMNFIFNLFGDTEIIITIFNITGDKVAEIREIRNNLQNSIITWNCLDIAPGIYLVRAKLKGNGAGKLLKIKKIAIID